MVSGGALLHALLGHSGTGVRARADRTVPEQPYCSRAFTVARTHTDRETDRLAGMERDRQRVALFDRCNSDAFLAMSHTFHSTPCITSTPPGNKASAGTEPTGGKSELALRFTAMSFRGREEGFNLSSSSGKMPEVRWP
jgi:hypothetical protein